MLLTINFLRMNYRLPCSFPLFRSMAWLLLLTGGLVLLSCKQEPGGSTATNPATTSPDPAAEEAARQRQMYQSKLEQYYSALATETMEEARFFAPEVESFFGSRLTREQVGQSLRTGFSQVDNRRFVIDPATVQVMPSPMGGVIVEFSGEVSFVRTATGEQVRDPFANRVAFNAEGFMTRYESLPANVGHRGLTAATPDADLRSTAEAILGIFKSGKLQQLARYLPTEQQPMLLVRTGVYSYPTTFASINDLSKKAPWLGEGLPALNAVIDAGDLPAFDCDDLFSKKGTFLGSIPADYHEISSLMESVQREDLAEYNNRQMSDVRKLEASMSHMVIDTETSLCFFLGKEGDNWRLMVIDLASFDCSA